MCPMNILINLANDLYFIESNEFKTQAANLSNFIW